MEKLGLKSCMKLKFLPQIIGSSVSLIWTLEMQDTKHLGNETESRYKSYRMGTQARWLAL